MMRFFTAVILTLAALASECLLPPFVVVGAHVRGHVWNGHIEVNKLLFGCSWWRRYLCWFCRYLGLIHCIDWPGSKRMVGSAGLEPATSCL